MILQKNPYYTRSYRVDFSKLASKLGFRVDYSIGDGAREVYEALKDGRLKPDDPKTITVKWYRYLLEAQRLVRSVELNGVIL